MMRNKVRWGILSTAQIARKNWKAIRNTGNSTVAGVASRELDKSRAFIAACQAEAPMENMPAAFGSYGELLASPEIDAVYIPLPTGLRKEWVIRAARAGKHIVCEKPCAASLEDLREMLGACRDHDARFMDGVMFMHSARLRKLREALDDPATIGKIKRIHCAFSFCAAEEFFRENIRADPGLEPHGCLGDLGWYCARFALWALGERLPRSVTGRMISAMGRGPARAPSEFSGELFFDEGVSASFYCSFLTGDEQSATVSGTTGQIRVADFVLPFAGGETSFEIRNATFKVQGCDFEMQTRSRTVRIAEHSHSHPSAQETNLFRQFSAQILSGGSGEPWAEMALRTQQVMEACLASARSGGRTGGRGLRRRAGF